MSRRTSGNKLLYTFKNEEVTIIEHVISITLESDVGPVITVLGHEVDKITRVLERFLPTITIVINEDYIKGMSNSVKTGVQKAFEMSPDCPVMIIPADCALVTAADIRKVAKAHLMGDRKITVASYKGRTGHPVVFNNDLFPELLTINEETYGLKAVIKRHLMTQVDTGNPGILTDFDTDKNFNEFDQKR
jgi:molybdenum cofactor cytidylyltransferase